MQKRVMQKILYTIIVILSVHEVHVHCYHLPPLNLGLTNILEGGPIRPNPGWYWIQYGSYYTTHKFLDEKGFCLGNVPSPHFSRSSTIAQIVYQTESKPFLNAHGGFTVAIPFVLTTTIDCKNVLQIINGGNGAGDISGGVYLQWDPVFYHDRPLFVHRIDFSMRLPTGKNNRLPNSINPGSNVFVAGPYWAGTFFITSAWGLSWRLQYAWISRNKITNIRAGSPIYLNYSIEYQLYKHLWVALNGYFLQQLNDSMLCGKPIANSRERVFSAGPGALYLVNQDLVFVTNLYFESGVRNRTQGIQYVLRFIKHF